MAGGIHTVAGATAVAMPDGEANFLPAQTAGIVLRSVLTVTPPQTLGMVLMQSPVTATIRETPGIVLSDLVSGSPSKPANTPGFDIVHTKFDLVHTGYVSASAQTAVGGRSDWTNLSNAHGAQNSDNAIPPLSPSNCASIAGGAGVRGGQLDLDFGDFVDKDALTITKVELRFYTRQMGTVANNGDIRMQWSKGGAITNLETLTGDFNSIGTPRLYDITAGISSWADLNALKAHVRFESAAGELQTGWVDAVQVRVEATLTEVQ